MNRSPFTAHQLLSDPAYARLKEHLIGSTGLAYYADKDTDLAARVVPRLTKRGLFDCASYLALLRDGADGEAELDALIEDLTIGETFFFRHREMFDALRTTVLPELIERNRRSRQLRIWSAGCSTGAEPYSIAILLKRDLAPQIEGWDVTIVGTDINREFLARAREGRYEEWAFRSTPEDLKRSCFLGSGTSWLLKPEFKEGVSFQYHNMVTHPFPSLLHDLFSFDLILCRNVTIYFAADIVRRLVDQFHQCLVEGGWLLVGHAEPNMELFRSYRTVNLPGAILYQKTSQQPQPPLWLAPPSVVPEMQAPFASATQPWIPPTLPPWKGPAPSAEVVAASSPVAPREDRVRPPWVAPTSRLSQRDVIRSLADRGEWEEADRLCQNELKSDQLNAVVHFYHGLVQEQMGRHAAAEDSLRRVIYLDRNFVLAHYYLGLLLQRKKQFPQAVRSFTNVLKLLANVSAAHVFVDGDGIIASELQKLTQMHLEVLAGA